MYVQPLLYILMKDLGNKSRDIIIDLTVILLKKRKQEGKEGLGSSVLHIECSHKSLILYRMRKKLSQLKPE